MALSKRQLLFGCISSKQFATTKQFLTGEISSVFVGKFILIHISVSLINEKFPNPENAEEKFKKILITVEKLV